MWPKSIISSPCHIELVCSSITKCGLKGENASAWKLLWCILKPVEAQYSLFIFKASLFPFQPSITHHKLPLRCYFWLHNATTTITITENSLHTLTAYLHSDVKCISTVRNTHWIDVKSDIFSWNTQRLQACAESTNVERRGLMGNWAENGPLPLLLCVSP